MLPLVDTHQHLIYPELFSYPWINDVPSLGQPFKLADYAELTKDAGIEAALFMEVDVAESYSAKEALHFMEQADSCKYSLAGVIAAGRPENEDFEAYLDCIASPRLKAIRRVLHVVDDSVSQTATFRKNIQLLGRRGLPFDLCILPPQHAVGIELVDACPNTQFVLDHCGNPNLSKPEQFDSWKMTLQQLAERENVTAKLSGIVASSSAEKVTIETVRPYLDATMEAFGADRLLWGSDWPVCTLTSSLEAWIDIFRQWLNSLSAGEQVLIANRNAKHIYAI
jgi:predicted TIM-barrel fold metal-dependent hydrolase